MEKRISALIIICLFCMQLLTQQTILIDAIHGVDYQIMDDQLSEIQFEQIFPDYEITKITPMDIQWSEMLVDQEVTGDEVYPYNVNLSNLEVGGALYVVAYPLDYRNIWGITGDIIDPDGAVVAELYQGVGHVDIPDEGIWEIEIEIGVPGNYQIKIGYGDLLFSNSEYTGTYNLNDFDLLLRIKNDEAFPFMGKYQEYSEADLTSLEEAFDNGLACLNCYNIFNPYVDKPFVHFYADSPLTIDYSVDFKGIKTLAKPAPVIRGERWQWQNLQLGCRSDNELIYEGIYLKPFNFIQFNGTKDFLKLKNQTEYSLNNIYLLRYRNSGTYEITHFPEIKPEDEMDISEVQILDGKELKSELKEFLYQDALAIGLSEIEAKDFFFNYNWIETMLHRAYDNPDNWICLYQFGKDLYDRIIPCYLDPEPSELNRNMWIMVSNIDPAVEVEPVELLDRIVRPSEVVNYRVNEYGIIDEYYSMNFGSREDEFFGINLNEWSVNFSEQNMLFYDNELANEISTGVDNLTSFQYLNFICDDYEENGILHEEYTPQYPISVAKKIGENGRLIVLGTSYTFDNQTNNNQFLRNAVDALLNSQFFTDSDPHQIPDNERYDLAHYPNPFRVSDNSRGSNLTINFNIPEDKKMVELAVFNIKGQKVKKLLSAPLVKGAYSLNWDGTDDSGLHVSTGVYFYRLRTEDDDSGNTRKVVKMK